MPCNCGAPDCPRCFPQNFTQVGSRRLYTAEMDDDQVETMQADQAQSMLESREEA